MLFGICGKIDLMAAAKELGFDYLEMSVSALAALNEDEFVEVQKTAREVGLPTPVCNGLIPGSIPLIGENRDPEQLEKYLRHAFGRLNKLGVQIVVFGSGAARKCPESVSYTEAWRQLVESTKIIGRIAGEYGITVVIEPLQRRECNMINSMAEGACLQADVNMPSVELLTDFYHVVSDNEPISDITRIGSFSHVHIAARYQRRYPLPGQPDDYLQFFARLKAIGYDAHLSIEGRCDDFAKEGAVSLRYIKELWAQADPAAL